MLSVVLNYLLIRFSAEPTKDTLMISQEFGEYHTIHVSLCKDLPPN